MTSDDRNRADARFNKAARAASEAKTVKSDRDVATKAVLDNMAKLKALRLAREAAAPPVAPKKTRGKSSAVKSSGKKTAEKGPALADWLAGQQSGGRRT
ncbi:MAG: hypothetical protein JWL86_1634 [Rhizobium sp.]|nr:hypothetical protein [Rhizobium sp.]